MTDPAPRLTPRQRYLENRQRKQNLTFSVTASVMAVLVIISTLVVTGIIKVPFGQEFSSSPKVAEIGDVPCPSASTKPSDPSTVTVQVFNAGGPSGQAKDVTSMLNTAGFKTLNPENATATVPTSVTITAGPHAIDAAYTVARFFPDAQVTLSDSAGTTVTVTTGAYYDGVLSADDIQKTLKDDSYLESAKSCLPVDASILDQQSGSDETQSGGSQSGTESTDQTQSGS